MTANIEQYASAGVDSLWWAVNSSAGYPYGQTGTIANGSDSSLQRLLAVQNFGMTLQQPRRVTVEGDDSSQAIFFFESAELPSGDLVLGVFDVNFVAQAQGAAVYTDGDFDTVALQIAGATFRDLTVLTNSQAKSRMSGSSGQAQWMVKIYPKVQVIPLGDAGLTQAAATSFTHALIANKSDRKPWGVSFSEVNDGTTEAALLQFASENRVCMHTHVANGTDVNFTLAKTPAAATANKIKVWRNGVLLTITTDWTVSGSVITLVVAGTAGDVVVCRYEYTE